MRGFPLERGATGRRVQQQPRQGRGLAAGQAATGRVTGGDKCKVTSANLKFDYCAAPLQYRVTSGDKSKN